jgi:hypothetical protein
MDTYILTGDGISLRPTKEDEYYGSEFNEARKIVIDILKEQLKIWNNLTEAQFLAEDIVTKIQKGVDDVPLS